MKNIKNFKLFVEGYSDELTEILENEENNYIVMKSDDIIAGYEYLEDAFDHISDMLLSDGTLDEEQVYEFNDMVSEMVSSNPDELVDQIEIDEMVKSILDQFSVIEPYKIFNRMELEETPVDTSFHEDEDVFGDYDEDEDQREMEEVLGESNDPYCMVGINGDSMEEVDSFLSQEEADSYLDEYRSVYTEYDDMKVIHREEMNESNLIFTPNDTHSCNCDVDCECREKGECNCGDDCNCPTCKEMRISSTKNESFKGVKNFGEFLNENIDEDIPPM